MLSDNRFKLQDEGAVWLALEQYQQEGVELSDALIASVNQQYGCTHTVTFDEKATRITHMKLLS